jgi:hypothetical protein
MKVKLKSKELDKNFLCNVGIYIFLSLFLQSKNIYDSINHVYFTELWLLIEIESVKGIYKLSAT